MYATVARMTYRLTACPTSRWTRTFANTHQHFAERFWTRARLTFLVSFSTGSKWS
jgi:hypothetical protein